MSDILSQIEKIQGNVRDIKATWGNTIMTLDNIKSSLKADRQKAIEEAYQKGFEAGQHEATTLEYQQGLDDAWECARKLVTNWYADADDVFEDKSFVEFLNAYTASEAIAKLKAYEDKQSDRIEVGDEVIAPCGKAIVTTFKNDLVFYLYSVGNYGCTEPENLTKTGRHFDIQSILEAMRT